MLKKTLVSFAASLLPLIAGCTTNPSTGQSQLILLSSEETAKMGEEAKPQLTQEYGGEVPSKELRDYVSGVGRKLVKQVEPDYEGIQWEFTTLNSDVINAFALPGGKIFISRGILEQFETEAEVAAVLGHEIGHVTGRHVDERISHAMIVSGLAGAAGIAAGSTDSQWAAAIPLVVGVGGQGYLLKFGRDQERQADLQGLKYMTRAGYSPEGMVDVLHVLIEASKGSTPPEILSTHPNPENRLTTVQEKIKTEYAFTRDNPEYKTFKSRFQRGAVPYLKPKTATSGRRGVVGSPESWCALCGPDRGLVHFSATH